LAINADILWQQFLRNIVVNTTAFSINTHAFIMNAIAFFAINVLFSLNRLAQNTDSTCFFARAGAFKTER